MIKKIIQKVIKKLGYTLVKNNVSSSSKNYSDPMKDGLKRNSILIPKVSTIIDVGAAAGTWYEKSLQVWPDADYVLFEPLIERKNELELIKQKNTKVMVRHSALGKETSTLQFTISDDLDGSGFYGKGNQREVQVEALDEVIREQKKSGPFILKLDTHGFEIPILEGAVETLKNTELIIVEVYGFYVAPNSLLFWQICEYLDKQGFRMIDMLDMMRRKKDGAFWQCDAFFIKKSQPLFLDNAFL